ncbi:MAG: hypothetical protein O3B01_15670 [Planctomycetota bacterium]|nr:hypothetical protein [Planctomycetota bacterium]MDA1140014.1 hypothetical protein [Planctomycetota bacterium]
MSQVLLKPVSLERMVRAVEKVRERLERVTSILSRESVPYAVAGGNAVAAWVARVDEAAVRNTQDVDILLRKTDLQAAQDALTPEGFVYRNVAGVHMFLDGADAKPRDAVHLVWAGEKVREEYVLPAPDVTDSDTSGSFTVVALEALVKMKLTSNRRKDQVHVLDMIEVGLIDESWPLRLPPVLSNRLQELLDNPDG